MPEERRIQHPNVTVDAAGRILVVADAVAAGIPTVNERWAHPSSEVFLFVSTDGGRRFEAAQVSAPNRTTANWLPAISHVGPSHDLRTPVILYTQGMSGTGTDCRDPERTRVFVVRVE